MKKKVSKDNPDYLGLAFALMWGLVAIAMLVTGAIAGPELAPLGWLLGAFGFALVGACATALTAERKENTAMKRKLLRLEGYNGKLLARRSKSHR